MKAITKRIQKFSRPGVILLATVVAIITSMVVANATQSITTPNAAFISYNLAAQSGSAAITPATSKSVQVMGCCITAAAQGVGQVSLQHIPSAGFTWVGLEPSGAVTHGTSSAAGAHIVFIDSTARLDIRVASADTIQVYNSTTVTRAGNVTLVW